MTTTGEAELRHAAAQMRTIVDAYNGHPIGFIACRDLTAAYDRVIFAVRDHLPAVLAELDRLRAAAAPEDSELYWKDAMR